MIESPDRQMFATEEPPAAAPIIRLRNVSFRYPGAENPSLRNVNLAIEAGEFIAIAGTNGSGKSTLCKTLNGLIPHYYVGDLEGDIEVAGLSAGMESVSTLSRKVSYVFQDFENQLVRPTVYDEAIFAPLNFGYPDYKDRGERALAMLGLEHLKHQWIWQLSGGQKHLTALAGAMSLDPDILIVDEPVAQLDPYHARLIYEKLKLLNERHGKTIIVIEHHTEFIADYCSKVVLMDGGEVRWMKPVSESLSAVEELAALHILPPQVTLAAYAVNPQARLHPVTLREGVDYFRQHKARFDANVRLRIISEEEPHDNPPTADDDSNPDKTSHALVQIDNVSYGYKTITRERHPVIRQLSLQLNVGDRVALVGNNGAGKSTLLRLISGLRKPNEGQLTVCGHPTARVTPEKLADFVAYIHQNPEEMFIEDTVRKDVEYFLKARKSLNDPTFIDEIMSRMRLTGLQERDGRLLSGGQQRRATLAIGLAMLPEVMLLDEPTASLDAASRRELGAMLTELQGRVKLSVIATHDMQLVAEWATRVIVLHQGTVIMDADPQTLFGNSALLQRAGLVPPQITTLACELGIHPVPLSVDQFVDCLSPMRASSAKPTDAWKGELPYGSLKTIDAR
ncbi:ATP-binding cassette domain-containing protein [Paenibacillus sp. LHD-117]|uniref:ABC transporter ATP-binding protein n=1 Tax=Paenibacillus sp. LHD-117 TaxID=3071412 RepID=UPI0027DFC230|nr:ATP-binding cassette domain-containing protein [Paenibacillus sp. LHD-117]MDQ6422184.1 ATP-binding cassette domain-containing protein [Paenibacillus sp. LHD-117]